MSEDLGDLYASIERFATTLSILDKSIRFLMGFLYILLIGELIGVPLPKMIEYISQYAKVLPVLLEPYRVQILFVTLLIDSFDAFFGNILIRVGGEKYVKVIVAISFLLGMLAFFGYPSLIVFAILVLPKFLSLFLIFTHPETVKALVNVYAKGSFE